MLFLELFQQSLELLQPSACELPHRLEAKGVIEPRRPEVVFLFSPPSIEHGLNSLSIHSAATNRRPQRHNAELLKVVGLDHHLRLNQLGVAIPGASNRPRGDFQTEDALAWALFRAGRLREADDAARRATRLGTPDARLLYHAGAIRLARGDARGGRALIRRALALNPSFDAAEAAEARRLVGERTSASAPAATRTATATAASTSIRTATRTSTSRARPLR